MNTNQADQVLRQPMQSDLNRIAKVLDTCKKSGKEFTLKVWVNYGQRVMRLHGYHIHGEPWVIVQKPDAMPHFTEALMSVLMEQAGVKMKMQAVKQPGFDYHWCCVSVDTPEEADKRFLRHQGNLSRDGAENYAPFLQAVATA